MRNGSTVARLVLGGYLAAHGAQKLFGMFGGHGLEGTGKGFERLGLTPGREMAMLAGAAELGGGVLTATALAEPLGPIAIVGTMTVATFVHRPAGPLAANGGFELPLTNLALAGVLLAAGHRGRNVTTSLPAPVTGLALAVAAALTGMSVAKVLNAGKAEKDPAPEPEAATG